MHNRFFRTVPVCLLIAWEILPCAALQKGTKKMPADPYFHPLALQLIETPAASQQGLDAAEHHLPYTQPPGSAAALLSSRSWVEALLKPEVSPPPDTPFVAFAQEEHRCDVVRARYKAGPHAIEIAQAHYLISITLKEYPSHAGESAQKTAERAARLLFRKDDHFHFLQTEADAKREYGRQDAEGIGRISREWPHWLDQLRWWRNGKDVGFLTVKANGAPTRAVLSPEEHANRHWFD